MKYITAYAVAIAAMFAFMTGGAIAASDAPFEGRTKCSNCHKSQAKSWKDTAHAKAMESLKPNTKKEAKVKAKLDPEKDYTQDKDCVGCHVDGFGKTGGYSIDAPKKPLTGVGCESCHGPGKNYRGDHRKAGQAFEKSNKTTPRKTLADKGQDFAFEESCNACHLNYEGSPWKEAKPPYTPFTPDVDPKYTFDFDKMVKDVKAMHEHFKLDGVFVGEPKFKYHDEFQANAKEGEKGKEE
ncbi:cytochrome c-550 CycA [Nitrosomonas communis]|uniref:Cytochrome c554 and c-prime n=1 Tax=Nitrosomonas communis TaxID=44574 RepID=A0A1H2YD53_9PROT|nr:cytochrome c-550 CycA [Nitrosomonas communis]SDX02905.1 Cytochrome c554 and c-prime [Nitrosomonas communis]